MWLRDFWIWHCSLSTKQSLFHRKAPASFVHWQFDTVWKNLKKKNTQSIHNLKYSKYSWTQSHPSHLKFTKPTIEHAVCQWSTRYNWFVVAVILIGSTFHRRVLQTSKEMVCVLRQCKYIWKINQINPCALKLHANIAPQNCPSLQTVGHHLLTRRTFCSSGSSWTNHNRRILVPVDENKPHIPNQGLAAVLESLLYEHISVLNVWLKSYSWNLKKWRKGELQAAIAILDIWVRAPVARWGLCGTCVV